MSDLISRSEVINIIESELKLRCGYQTDIALFCSTETSVEFANRL